MGCVVWYGDVTKDDQQAAIKMTKPGETSESVTYVNRVLAFIFATDESFEQLIKLPKDPFKMACGCQLCVHLGHVSLFVDGNGAAGSNPGSSFRTRTEQENQALIKEWSLHAKPRAREFFGTEEMLMDVLMKVALGIDRESDPVLGPGGQCVYWYGDVTKDDQ